MILKDLLKRIGLSVYESECYSSLLEAGPLTVAALAKKSGLHRPSVYNAIPSLQDKGLVVEMTKGKRKVYAAESPQKLHSVIAELQDSFDQLLPELEQAYAAQDARPSVRIVEGKKGLTSVLEDLIQTCKKGDIFYRYSSRKGTTNVERYTPKHYREQRDQKQLQQFVITNATLRQTSFKKRMECMSKVVPPEYDLFQYDVTQLIYGNKVALVDYNSETAVIIENEMIAKFQQKLFKLLFDKL